VAGVVATALWIPAFAGMTEEALERLKMGVESGQIDPKYKTSKLKGRHERQ